jgi:hypothetical protein
MHVHDAILCRGCLIAQARGGSSEEQRAAIAGALKLLAGTKEAQNGEKSVNRRESVNSGVNQASERTQRLTGS